MKVLEFPVKPNELHHPEEVTKLKQYLDDDGIKVNCDLKTLEKLWYAFSETWDASFLIVSRTDEDDTYYRFLEWVRPMTTDIAERIDVFGYIDGGRLYRPCDYDEEDEDD